MIAFAEPQSVDSFAQFAEAIRPGFIPRPITPSWEWVCTHGRTPDSQPFDGHLMPWAKGICEAWDNPKVREIVMMWGTRLGKTMISMQLVAKAMATAPLPGLFATANQTLATRTTTEKLYKVLAAIRQTRRQLPPEKLRSAKLIRLTDSTWPVIWSGSNTMLADWGACYGWANEVSKWDVKKSADGAKAGDTLSQFLERFKEFWHARKILFECSPGLKGHCKIERKFNESNQCQYYVPCPHCSHHQVLKLGNGDGTGGIVFEKRPDGRFDAELAQRTAYYQCEKCRKAIPNEARRRMMRAGVWAPKGCRVDKKGKLCGKPERTCEIWGGQLSSLYSLQMQWGAIARKFIESLRNPSLLQVFKNDWLAETWEPYHVKSEPEEVADRLRVEGMATGVMPAWSTHLVQAVDVQVDYFKWVKLAAGPNERVAVVDRGYCDTWNEVESSLNAPTPHDDGGASLLPCLTLIDSGDGKRTKEVYDFCRRVSRPDRLVIPCKGANNALQGNPYDIREIVPGVSKGTKRQRKQVLRTTGTLLIHVSGFYYEPIIQKWLDHGNPDEPDSLSLPEELADDEAFVRELCNGTMSDEPSKTSPDRVLWVKRAGWENEPNDFRDCLKYARCAVDLKFRKTRNPTRQPGNVAGARPVLVRTAAAPEPSGPRSRRVFLRERVRERRERTRRR